MILNKIFFFAKFFLNLKFKFDLPKNIELLIFDGESFDELKNVISDSKYFILETRINRIKKIYLNKNIIISIINNFKKNGFFNAYLLSVINQINPKIIFTFIDNSFKFSIFSQKKNKKYNFLALQNGARYEHKIYNQLTKKKIKNNFKRFFIPYFLCFGQHEINDYKKNKQQIKKFIKVGSLRLSNYLNFKKKNKIRIKKKKLDILLISDANCWDNIIKKLSYPVEEGVINLIKFTIKFATKNNLKIKIAARNDKDNFHDEKNFYKNNLSQEEYDYLKKNIVFRSSKYNTYIFMEKSKVVVGTMSTMLRENLSLGGKTFACNFTKTDIFNFPSRGICSFNQLDYSKFEKKLKKILSMSNSSYKKSLEKKISYIIHSAKKLSTIDLIKSQIRFFLEKND